MNRSALDGAMQLLQQSMEPLPWGNASFLVFVSGFLCLFSEPFASPPCLPLPKRRCTTTRPSAPLRAS